MTLYGVMFETHASTIVYYEADSPEEATEKALSDSNANLPDVCAQCGGWGHRVEEYHNTGVELNGDWEISEDDEPWPVDE